MAEIGYDREVLREVVIYHYKSSIEGCRCGYAKLGACNSEHVADEYEKAYRAKHGGSLMARLGVTEDELLCGAYVGTTVISVHNGVTYNPPLRIPATCKQRLGHDGDCYP